MLSGWLPLLLVGTVCTVKLRNVFCQPLLLAFLSTLRSGWPIEAEETPRISEGNTRAWNSVTHWRAHECRAYDGGPLYYKSTKQRKVTKSSTESELVGLSDTSSQAIHLRNFVIAQGYEVGSAVIYQDNLSCMALMKRGGPGSERSRHIMIRHFWICEKVVQPDQASSGSTVCPREARKDRYG